MNIPPLSVVRKPVKPVPVLSIYKHEKVPPLQSALHQKSHKVLDVLPMRRVKLVQERKISGSAAPEDTVEEPAEHILYVWEWFGRKRRKA